MLGCGYRRCGLDAVETANQVSEDTLHRSSVYLVVLRIAPPAPRVTRDAAAAGCARIVDRAISHACRATPSPFCLAGGSTGKYAVAP